MSSRNLLAEVFVALEIAVLEHQPDGRFEVLGLVPPWLESLWPETSLSRRDLAPSERFLFLENFLVDAEQSWLDGGDDLLKSGPWTETDARGHDHYLETYALTVGGSRVLLLERLGSTFSEQRAVIQRSREMKLLHLLDVAVREQTAAGLRADKESSEAANRAKSAFLARMSHELRTPLNAVIGFANVLLRKCSDRLEAKDVSYLERILANGKHLLSLVNDILDLSKIEAGRMELELAPVELGRLVGEVLQHVESQVTPGEVELCCVIPEPMAELTTDARKLKQVLINLVGNALKFTPSGTITVEVEVDEDSRQPQRIDVVDTGVGIPRERLGAIFEAFEQAQPGARSRYGGTGLGLTISRSLLHQMGYDVGVESVVGRGTRFSIHLKRATATVD